MCLSEKEWIRSSTRTVRIIWSPKSRSQTVAIRSEPQEIPDNLSLSLSLFLSLFKNSIVSWLTIDGQIVKVKFFVLLSVSLNRSKKKSEICLLLGKSKDDEKTTTLHLKTGKEPFPKKQSEAGIHYISLCPQVTRPFVLAAPAEQK